MSKNMAGYGLTHKDVKDAIIITTNRNRIPSSEEETIVNY